MGIGPGRFFRPKRTGGTSYGVTMFDELNLRETSGFTLPFRNRVKIWCEDHPIYEPTKWVTLTFKPEALGAYDLQEAVKAVRSWSINVSRKCNAHGFPVGVIGTTNNGMLNSHLVWMNEKGRRKPTARMMKRLWYDSGKRGYVHNKNYNPDQGCIPYSLNPDRNHFAYITIQKPFCPKKASKCKPTCVRRHNFIDPLLDLLGPTGT